MAETNFVIEPMMAAHIESVLQIEKECGLNHGTFESYQIDIKKQENLIFVAINNKKILGFVSARLISSVVEIINIGVLPEARRNRAGQALLEEVLRKAFENNALECWLEVRNSNLAAQKFYLTNKFKIVGRRKKYYSNPVEDGILMTLIFSDENPKI
jgi:ribosomal-protein-alanine N-acetyltransferase